VAAEGLCHDARAYVFPGQGAQFVGMGGQLFARFPDVVQCADEMLGYSIEELCLADPRRVLSRTDYTQPAMYVVNALSYWSYRDAGAPVPRMVAGHSLGEYNALLVADAFTFEQGLQLVMFRGELMRRAASGAMAAVVGLEEGEVRRRLVAGRKQSVDIANINSPSQIVISGAADEVRSAENLFMDVTFVQLNVSGAFHSRLMAPLVAELRSRLTRSRLQTPRIEVISNVTARPYPAESVCDYLARQLSEPVRWCDTVRYMMGHGVARIEEVGPGTTLTKLTRSICGLAEGKRH
jgi:trans-AT polyketide synthase, acyltransferase and oxidoreductase domains